MTLCAKTKKKTSLIMEKSKNVTKIVIDQTFVKIVTKIN